jgi:hypothetical protein
MLTRGQGRSPILGAIATQTGDEEVPVPQILVVTDKRNDTAGDVVYSERIAPADFDSTHFTGQLAERVGWAVRDANRLEHREELAARVRGETSLDVSPGRPALSL